MTEQGIELAMFGTEAIRVIGAMCEKVMQCKIVQARTGKKRSGGARQKGVTVGVTSRCLAIPQAHGLCLRVGLAAVARSLRLVVLPPNAPPKPATPSSIATILLPAATATGVVASRLANEISENWLSGSGPCSSWNRRRASIQSESGHVALAGVRMALTLVLGVVRHRARVADLVTLILKTCGRQVVLGAGGRGNSGTTAQIPWAASGIAPADGKLARGPVLLARGLGPPASLRPGLDRNRPWRADAAEGDRRTRCSRIPAGPDAFSVPWQS